MQKWDSSLHRMFHGQVISTTLERGTQVQKLHEPLSPRPAIGAQAWFCRDKNSKSAVRFFVHWNMAYPKHGKKGGTLALPCGDRLLASTTAIATSSTLEDGIFFRPVPATMPSCFKFPYLLA
ncbi:hypothetical protein AVEN_267759-1 [Araneus ventricosus]|uniref:Uncharacterized protein n=1 Tax=Araneus ventricosus TaxID=182803 RepID=A0A4Y2EZ91_ARAVE|nr:hypothetical protein AVEN_267759-1 [Araneus ventricosus]